MTSGTERSDQYVRGVDYGTLSGGHVDAPAVPDPPGGAAMTRPAATTDVTGEIRLLRETVATLHAELVR